jgi:hypothetical protein
VVVARGKGAIVRSIARSIAPWQNAIVGVILAPLRGVRSYDPS